VAFRFIAANDHPDHDTIAAFRRRFLKEIEALFVQVLLLAREMGVLKMGTVALDGTKIHANASRHSALSYEQMSPGRRQPRGDRRQDLTFARLPPSQWKSIRTSNAIESGCMRSSSGGSRPKTVPPCAETA
jgi:hypothetical protein